MELWKREVMESDHRTVIWSSEVCFRSLNCTLPSTFDYTLDYTLPRSTLEYRLSSALGCTHRVVGARQGVMGGV
jgi:hypothetical protein